MMTPEMKAKLEEMEKEVTPGSSRFIQSDAPIKFYAQTLQLIAHIRDLYSVIAMKDSKIMDAYGFTGDADCQRFLDEALAIKPTGTLGE